MAQTVATGEVVLLAKFPGIKKATEEALGGPVSQTNKKYAYKGGQLFAGTWSKVVKGAGLGTALVAGMAIKGGWDRAIQKDNAEAALRGLGHSASNVSGIMDNALASVKGTAFGMGEAATVAASSVAAGVKPGKDLERTLKLTADAASIAGISMGDMGSIFNKVAAKNKLSMQEVNMLTERGVPILEMVAKQMGVTQEEAAKMASEGKISFDIFRDAIETNMGGAALKSGETAQGTLRNVGASLSRFGEQIVNKLLPYIKKGGAAFIEFADTMTEYVGPVVSKVADFLKDWGPTILGIIGPLAAFIATFNTIQGVVAKIQAVRFAAMGLFNVIKANPVVAIIAGIVAVGVALYTLYQKSETFRNFVDGMIEKMRSFWNAIGPVGQRILSLVPALVAGAAAGMQLFKVVSLLKSGVMAFTAVQRILNVVLAANPIGLVIAAIGLLIAGIILLWNHSETFRNIVLGAWEAIKTAVSAVITWFQTTVVPILQAVWDGIKAGAQWLADAWNLIWTGIKEVFTLIWEGIKLYITTVITVIQTIITTVLTVISTVWNAIWEGIKLYVTTVWTGIKTVILTVFNAIKTTITTIINAIRTTWTTIWNAIKTVVSTIWNGIKSAISGAINAVSSTVSSVLNTIKSTFTNVWNGIKNGVSGAWDGIKSAVRGGIDSMMSFIRDIPNKIKNVFSGAGNWLWDAGKKIINGLIDGIKNMFGSVQNTLSSLTSYLPSWKGPAQRDRKLLVGPAKLIMQGFQHGLEDQYATIRASLQGFTGDLVPDIKPSNARASVAGGFGSPGRPIEVHQHVAVAEIPKDASIASRAAQAARMYSELQGAY